MQTYDPEGEKNISVESHYLLISNLQTESVYSKEAMSDEQWAAKRRAEAQRWMIAWDRMEAAIDPNWNPDELLSGHVTPPAEKGPIPGQSPDAIKDPALRAEYEKALDERNEGVQRYTEQRRLGSLKKQFARSLIQYFGGTYSIPPFNDAELESLLSQHIHDEEICSAIRQAVAEQKAVQAVLERNPGEAIPLE